MCSIRKIYCALFLVIFLVSGIFSIHYAEAFDIDLDNSGELEDSLSLPMPATFTVTIISGGIAPYEIEVNFGDSSPASKKTAYDSLYTFIHIFNNPQVFNVTISVTNANNETLSDEVVLDLTQATSEELYVISGNVTNSSSNVSNNAPVKDASVYVNQEESNVSQSDGSFALLLPEGEYEIYANKNGLLSQTVTASIPPDSLDVSLKISDIIEPANPPPRIQEISIVEEGKSLAVDWSGYEESLTPEELSDLRHYKVYSSQNNFTDVNDEGVVLDSVVPKGSQRININNLSNTTDYYVAITAFDQYGQQYSTDLISTIHTTQFVPVINSWGIFISLIFITLVFANRKLHFCNQSADSTIS